MQFKGVFLLCALQAVQFALAQCGCGSVVASDSCSGAPGYQGIYPGNQAGYAGNLGYNSNLHSGYSGYPAPVFTPGDIEAAGTLPVSGPVAVDGRVPVEGSVNYAGDVSATGTACAACSCGNIWV